MVCQTCQEGINLKHKAKSIQNWSKPELVKTSSKLNQTKLNQAEERLWYVSKQMFYSLKIVKICEYWTLKIVVTPYFCSSRTKYTLTSTGETILGLTSLIGDTDEVKTIKIVD